MRPGDHLPRPLFEMRDPITAFTAEVGMLLANRIITTDMSEPNICQIASTIQRIISILYNKVIN